jgi:2-dehydropantoate 2-reductase
MNMKIAIIGPGAMGCLFAGALARKGQEVWLLDKDPERAAKINSQGISCEGVSGSWKAAVKATNEPKQIKEPDLVIICVKTYDTKSAAISAKALLGPGTSVLTLQNGIGNIELISEVVGPERVIGGVTNLGVTLLDTGKVRHAGKGETVIGRLDGSITVDLREIREAFIKSGFETRISRDIKSFLWSKLIINVGINALCAITRLNNGKLLDYETSHKILKNAVNEAVKVAKRKRIKLSYEDPLTKVEAVCEATCANVCSMLQDVLKKRRTEIDSINGVIVRYAEELGIAAPTNTMLVDLVKTIESSYAAAL